ncbi:collagenase 3-like [Temnothorax longispinosus]|uniref:collagenase 3-like n=1 Tax=Temnothorax longispinosus TaxID=300112 RepID=UPI003A994001
MLHSQGNELCAAPFDGFHKDVAHAFFPTGEPNYIWEVHVDKSETWHIQLNKNPPGRYNLLQTLTHEIGHALGLAHSPRKDSVMFAYVPVNQFPVQLNGKTYKKPLLLTDYMKFLPKNFTHLTAAYQAPSGNIVLFAGNMSYMITYPRVKLDSTWPRSHTDLGLLDTNAKINAVLNTNEGRSYIIYNDNVVGEIDDCSMTIVKFYHIDIIFPGIPHSVSSAFRYIDGNLYFISKNRFYRFNEFTKTVTASGNLIWGSSVLLARERD